MYYYDVFPKVVPADRESEIWISPRFEHAFFPAAEQMRVYCIPFGGRLPDHSWKSVGLDPAGSELKAWHLNGRGQLILTACFASEQEHSIIVELLHPERPDQVRKRLVFAVYSLEPDLLALRPFKGDFHMHTTRSDGIECPAFVPARYRQEGFDFVAVSDHRRYEPSLEAIRFWEKVPLDFRLFPGEEVHAPDNRVHIINFGADASVNQMYRDDEPAYRREVREILDGIDIRDPGLDYYAVASSEWVFRKIREHHGLAVFCHPYWAVGGQNVLNEGLISEMFRRRKFDAFELIGGYSMDEQNSNNFQVARWQEEQSRGNRFPVVGLSDSHGTTVTCHAGSRNCQLFSWYFTVILAKSDSIDDLIDGVRKFHSVAVNAPDGQSPEILGDFRIVRYVDFLRREYFPIQKNLCRTEGNLMLDYLAGDDAALTALAALKGRVPRFREACFGRK